MQSSIKRIKSILSALLATSVLLSVSACGYEKKSSTSEEEDSKERICIWNASELEGTYEPSIGTRIDKTIDGNSYSYEVEYSSSSKVILFDENNHEKYQINSDSLVHIDNRNINITYGVDVDISDVAIRMLDELMLGVEVSQDVYCDYVESVTGERLTDYDLTSNINVYTADMHHVTSANGVTVIFLHFPDPVIDEMYDYYCDLFVDAYQIQYCYDGDDYRIITDGDDHLMLIVDGTFISVAGSGISEANEILGFPDVIEVREILSLIS